MPKPMTDPRKLTGPLRRSSRATDLLDLHRQHSRSFNHVNLATCWSRLGNVSPPERGWLQSDDGARLLALADQTSRQVRAFNSRSVALTAHALANLAPSKSVKHLWTDLEGVALARKGDFKPKELADTAWALATAGRTAPKLFVAIAFEVARHVRAFNPQGLATIAWAFATAGHTATALFDAIAAETTRRVRKFSPQELASTAWAFAIAGHAAPALFDAIAAKAARRVRNFKPQDLANTAWAFATADHAAPALFDAIAAEAVRRVGAFIPQELAKTAWAFATAGHAAPVLFDEIGAEAAWCVRDFKSQDLANTAWALAAANHLPVVSTLFDQRCALRCEALANEFSREELCQLHEWRLWYEGERGCSDALPGAKLLARCASAWVRVNPRPYGTQTLELGTRLSSAASSEKSWSFRLLPPPEEAA